MCSSKWKHCGTRECKFCFERSLASYSGLTAKGNLKSGCIVHPDHLRFPLNSAKKVQFRCDVCEHVFNPRLYKVTRGRWCPHCKNKTELKVFRFLTRELKLQVRREYVPPFVWRDYRKRCRFDFLLVGLGVVLEIDGPQHTKEVSKTWIRTTLLHRQIVDKWKEFLARRDGKLVFRFDQHAIWTDSYDWRTKIRILLK